MILYVQPAEMEFSEETVVEFNSPGGYWELYATWWFGCRSNGFYGHSY